MFVSDDFERESDVVCVGGGLVGAMADVGPYDRARAAGVSRATRRRVRIGIGCVVAMVGVACVAFGAASMAPDFMTDADYGRLSEEAHVRADNGSGNGSSRRRRPSEDADGVLADDAVSVSDAVPAASETGSGALGGGSGDGGVPVMTQAVATPAADVDLSVVREEVASTVAWVELEGTSIDYPVVQGSDNDWYLTHDMFGRESDSAVFLDYRCRADGRARLVYSHTHVLDFGFHAIAEADDQGVFNGLGTLSWTADGVGTERLLPLCALHVDPSFQDVQTFSFAVDPSVEASALRSISDAHAEAGEWNAQGDHAGDGVTGAVVSMWSDEGEALWWLPTDEERRRAHDEAEAISWRTWAAGMVEASDARASNAGALIAHASRSVTLSCCSWPWDGMRTVVVWVG